ncbi:MAG: hypothetical protein L3I99_05635 [Sulfurimonas sp.]|nr:hypothetical protein [Sulfurimonas sp.]
MKNITKPKKFLLLTFSIFSISVVLYILAFHFIGNKKMQISHSYKEFLLINTVGSRFIIDSGSNSKHSIDAYELEKEFAIQVINLGDNGGYPLEQKLARLEKHLHKGDIVLLPLEWQYYSRKNIESIFSTNILSKLNYYYNFYSFMGELKLIGATPYIDIISVIKEKNKLHKNQNNYIKLHLESYANHERGSSARTLAFDESITDTCDEYVLSEQLKNGFILSDKFKKNMQIIKRLKANGTQIVFTWPVVAGDDCYSEKNKKKLDNFIIDIRDYLEENNISIIGDPYENKFSTKNRSDTFYHINSNAQKIKTQRLINQIKQSSLGEELNKNDHYKYLQYKKGFARNIMDLWNKTYEKNEKIDFRFSKIVFYGWSNAEKDFRWSSGNKSELIFKFNPKDALGVLSLNIKTLGKQNIKISINEIDIGAQSVNSKDTTIKFKFNPKILDEINTISFYFPNAHKPNAKDTRILAMALKSFMIK